MNVDFQSPTARGSFLLQQGISIVRPNQPLQDVGAQGSRFERRSSRPQTLNPFAGRQEPDVSPFGLNTLA